MRMNSRLVFTTLALAGLTVPLWAAGTGSGEWQSYLPNGAYTNSAGPYNNPNAYAGEYGNLRALVNRTQNDLRYAAEIPARKAHARDRYEDAQGHLSSFDRKLSRGRFDRGELNKSIDKLRAILNKNVLQGTARNALERDINELLAARDYRG